MADVTVVEVPQWQGSASATARRLRDGARLLAARVPAGRRIRVDVGDETGPGALAAGAARIRAVLERAGRDGNDFLVTVGGDCGIELEPVAAAARRYGDRLAVVWFDAHGDLNTPASSPSGAFHGMVLRTLLGEGPAELVPRRPLHPRQVVLAGVRELDPGERAYVAAAGIPIVTDPEGLLAAVAGADVAYVHIDLDVLDPAAFGSVGTPAPGGLSPDRLLAMVEALAGHVEIAGLSITEYEPADTGPAARTRDERVLAGLVGPVVAACRSSAVRQIDRRARRAWPAEIAEERAGWLLRHTPGVGRRRSNSALALAPGAADTIDHVTAFYRERDRPALIQVRDDQPELDAALAGRGHRRDAPTTVLTAFTADVVTATGGAAPVELVGPADRRAAVFTELDGHGDSAAVAEKVIARIDRPTAFLTVTRDGRAAGMGLVVADAGWAGLFCMATRPELRRHGIATAVLAAGARWAAGQGAYRLYLQVEADNDAARALYARAGFRPSYGYHYRIVDGG